MTRAWSAAAEKQQYGMYGCIQTFSRPAEALWRARLLWPFLLLDMQTYSELDLNLTLPKLVKLIKLITGRSLS